MPKGASDPVNLDAYVNEAIAAFTTNPKKYIY